LILLIPSPSLSKPDSGTPNWVAHELPDRTRGQAAAQSHGAGSVLLARAWLKTRKVAAFSSDRSGVNKIWFCNSDLFSVFILVNPVLFPISVHACAVTRWVNARGKKKGSTGRGGIPGDPKLRGACLMCDSHPSTKPVPVQRHRCEIDTPFRLTKAALLQRRRQRQDSPGLLSVQRS